MNRTVQRLNEPRQVQISKAPSNILRHRAVVTGLKLRSDGYCELASALQVKRLADFECTAEEVEEVVLGNDKVRFETSTSVDGIRLIRAAQGHSMKGVVDGELLSRLRLDDADLPKHCIHGTYYKLDPIFQSRRLLAGGNRKTHACNDGRNHVHFGPRNYGDKSVISGM